MEFKEIIHTTNSTNFDDLMKALLDNEINKIIDSLFENEQITQNNNLEVAELC